jgi:hypothetical protein
MLAASKSGDFPMKSAKYLGTPNKDERIALAVPAGFKARVFEAAAARGVPASELVRQALSAVLEARAA